jgi:hypothetical protein
MSGYRFLILLFSICLLSSSANATKEHRCLNLIKPPDLSHAVSNMVEADLKSKGFSKSDARGYAILIATMIVSAAATTYVSSTLPPQLQFVSHFLAQISALGIYVYGAPIWEPLSSAFRKMAFGVRKPQGVEPIVTDSELEALWRRTQENYSLNAQMSRNVINQFIISVQQNFYEAHRAMISNNNNFAMDQIADAAYRLRTLFRDIDPADVSIASVIRASFTNHIVVDPLFISQVMEKISVLDSDFYKEETQLYYQRLLKSWLSVEK